MMINKENFLLLIADILDMDTSKVLFSTNFREDCEYWDSLVGYSCIVSIEDEYNVEIPVDIFLQMATVEDIFNFVKVNSAQ